MESGIKKQWMAVYVRSRNEKKVADRLERDGVEVYLPLQETKRRWSDRIKKVQLPVIPSYVFVKTEEREREKILRDPAVMNFVFWLGKPAVIREEEIKRIQAMLDVKTADEEITFESLKPGDEITVETGAFQGEKAEVIEDRKREVSVILKGLGVRLTLSKLKIEASK